MRMLKDIESNIHREPEDIFTDPTIAVETVMIKSKENDSKATTSAKNVIEGFLDKTYPKSFAIRRSQIPTLERKRPIKTLRHSWHSNAGAPGERRTAFPNPKFNRCISVDPRRCQRPLKPSAVKKPVPGSQGFLSSPSPISSSSTISSSSSSSKCLSLEVVGHNNLSRIFMFKLTLFHVLSQVKNKQCSRASFT